jgi:hypothetical protein
MPLEAIVAAPSTAANTGRSAKASNGVARRAGGARAPDGSGVTARA